MKVTVQELLFADECRLAAGSSGPLQVSIDHFSSACKNLGIRIRTKKTVVLYQSAPRKTYTEPIISVKDQNLSAVDKFTYLTLSWAVHLDDEVNIRIVEGFGHLCDSIWEKNYHHAGDKTDGLQSIYITNPSDTPVWVGSLDSL